MSQLLSPALRERHLAGRGLGAVDSMQWRWESRSVAIFVEICGVIERLEPSRKLSHRWKCTLYLISTARFTPRLFSIQVDS